MRFLKDLSLNIGITLAMLLVMAGVLTLWSRYEDIRKRERESEIRQILENRLGPLEKRIIQLESKSK